MNTLAEARRKRAQHMKAMEEFLITKGLDTPDAETEYQQLDAQLTNHDKRIKSLEVLLAKSAKASKDIDGDDADGDDADEDKSDDDEEDGDDDNKKDDDEEDEEDNKKASSKGHSGRSTKRGAVKETKSLISALYDADVDPYAQANPFAKKKNTNMTNLIRHKSTKGSAGARFIIGAGLLSRSKSMAYATNYLREEYNDREVAKALQSNIQTNGGALIPQEYSAELIELAYAFDTFGEQLGLNWLENETGNLTLPRMNAGANSYWVGEAQQITVSQPGFDNVQIAHHILAGMVPITLQLLERSPLMVQSLVQKNIMRDFALKRSYAGYFGSGSSYQPTGLQTLGTTLSAVTISPTTGSGAVTPQVQLNQILNFIQTMELEMTDANIPLNGSKWVFRASVAAFLKTVTDSTGRAYFAPELATGKLDGLDVLIDNQFPNNINNGTANVATDVFLIQPAMVIASKSPLLRADHSTEASYWNGSSWVSANQNMEIVFRVTGEFDWNLEHPQAAVNAQVTGMQPTFYTTNTGGAAYSTQATSNAASVAQSANPTTTATPNT